MNDHEQNKAADDDAAFAYMRRPTRLYFSKPFSHYGELELRRFAYFVFEERPLKEFCMIEKEVCIRETPSGLQQIRAVLSFGEPGVRELTLQRFRKVDGHPMGSGLLSLRGEEIDRLISFLHLLQSATVAGEGRFRIEESEIDQYTVSDSALRKLISLRPTLVRQIVESELTTEEVTALAYRKAQLEVYERLLRDGAFADRYRSDHGLRGEEAIWQHFFQKNQWILGYGLTYIFASALSDGQLEQATTGHSVHGPGKRVDALLRTSGYVSSLCFVELKTPGTHLTRDITYRPGVWAPTAELAAGVAQVQKTVHHAVEQIRSRLATTDDAGLPTGEISYLYHPRSILIVGDLREFESLNGISQERYGSFELFRRNVSSPEIVTFDELLERARHIVTAGESAQAEPKMGRTVGPTAHRVDR